MGFRGGVEHEKGTVANLVPRELPPHHLEPRAQHFVVSGHVEGLSHHEVGQVHVLDLVVLVLDISRSSGDALDHEVHMISQHFRLHLVVHRQVHV